MEATFSCDNITGDIEFHGVIRAEDMRKLKLSVIGRAVLDAPCRRSSDFLLTAGFLFRLAEMQEASDGTTR